MHCEACKLQVKSKVGGGVRKKSGESYSAIHQAMQAVGKSSLNSQEDMKHLLHVLESYKASLHKKISTDSARIDKDRLHSTSPIAADTQLTTRIPFLFFVSYARIYYIFPIFWFLFINL